MVDGVEICATTRAGARRMPMPSVLPTMTARPKPTPRIRLRFEVGKGLRLDGHEKDVDGLADIARRVARAARFELDITARPPIHSRLAIRRVFDLATRQMDDERIGTVRVKRFARADVHARANHAHEIVLEERIEAHALEGRFAGSRPLRGRGGERRLRTARLNDDERAASGRL